MWTLNTSAKKQQVYLYYIYIKNWRILKFLRLKLCSRRWNLFPGWGLVVMSVKRATWAAIPKCFQAIPFPIDQGNDSPLSTNDRSWAVLCLWAGQVTPPPVTLWGFVPFSNYSWIPCVTSIHSEGVGTALWFCSTSQTPVKDLSLLLLHQKTFHFQKFAGRAPIKCPSAKPVQLSVLHWQKLQLLLHVHLCEPLEPRHIRGVLNSEVECGIYSSICSMSSALAVSCPVCGVFMEMGRDTSCRSAWAGCSGC